MSSDKNDLEYTGKGQASRLSVQHELAGGPIGIFGKKAKKHDLKIGQVTELILEALTNQYPDLSFRIRTSVTKKEINAKLRSYDQRLGDTLFVQNASIKPDGGVLEVMDKDDKWRILLVGESKHQGNDVEKIRAGIKQGKNKDQYLMAAGNAIERVHKNILEFRNLMLGEKHFPYVVFLQGSNFATSSFEVETPDGRQIQIVHDSGLLNRIDRVTASSYSVPINKNYCQNIQISIEEQTHTLQIPSLYFQCDAWESEVMYFIMAEVAITSMSVLSENGYLTINEK